MPRLAGLLVLASGFEIGIHNSTLAIGVALTVLESTAMAIPSAIYGIVLFPIAAACDAREGVMAEVNAALFFLVIRRPPRSTLSPCTALFRSSAARSYSPKS